MSIAITILLLLIFPITCFASYSPQPSSAECFNYDDGDGYQEENSCQCVVFQGPNNGSFSYEFRQQSPSLKRSGTIMTASLGSNNYQTSQQRCIFYLFLADLGDLVQVELENVPIWLKLVPVVNGGEARDASSYCDSPGKRPITSQSSNYSIRIFTELVRPEINAYDNFQYVLCEKDGTTDRRQPAGSFNFTSDDRIVAIQILQAPNANNSRQYGLRLTELRGRHRYYRNPAGSVMPSSKRPRQQESTAVTPKRNNNKPLTSQAQQRSKPVTSPLTPTSLMAPYYSFKSGSPTFSVLHSAMMPSKAATTSVVTRRRLTTSPYSMTTTTTFNQSPREPGYVLHRSTVLLLFTFFAVSAAH